MARLRRRPIDDDIERKIAIGLIVSDAYCREVVPVLDLKFLQVDHVRLVASWVMEYHEKYNKAPGKHIQDVFNSKGEALKEDLTETISNFLADISREYGSEDGINAKYLKDRTLDYFNKRGLELVRDGITAALTMDDIGRAEQHVTSYSKVARAVSGWVSPFEDQGYMQRVVSWSQEDLLQLPGALGEVMGPFRRNWLIGVMGPMKRGKTHWLEEIALQAMAKHLRVALITLEDEDEEIAMRMYKHLSGMVEPGEGGRFLWPVFDCWANQLNTCEDIPERVCRVQLLVDTGKKDKSENKIYSKPDFYDSPGDYKPCTFCRDKAMELSDRKQQRKYRRKYDVQTWFVETERPSMNLKSLRRKLVGMRTAFGNQLRLKSYPSFSATLGDVKDDLDVLEFSQDFVPDVIVIDYADILKPEDPRLGKVDQIDEIWKNLKGMAQERRALVVTASQTTRAGMDKKNIGGKDTPGNIAKLAHVNAMFTLNQDDREKGHGVMRVGVLVHRKRKFSLASQAKVLQQFELGQTCIDSELYTFGSDR